MRCQTVLELPAQHVITAPEHYLEDAVLACPRWRPQAMTYVIPRMGEAARCEAQVIREAQAKIDGPLAGHQPR